MGGKNSATKSNGGVKIAELGNELRVDPRQIVAAAQEMAMENAKVPASWVTAGQADRLRAKFGGHLELKARIERKLRHFESALETPTDAVKADRAAKAHTPKPNKKTFESDRRAIFGVVASTGGVRVEKDEPSHKSKAHAPAIEGQAPAARPAADNAAQPAAKFIGITVAPPIRREPGAGDPRFGVTVPVPASEKKEASTAIWQNLNDGRAPLELPASGTDAKQALTPAADSTPVAEPIEKAHKSGKKSTSHTGAEEASTERHDAVPATEVLAAAAHSHSTHVAHAPMQKREMEVPVKWQPKHKAFGSKAKLKAKIHKKLQSDDSGKHRADTHKAHATEQRKCDEPEAKRSADHKSDASSKPDSKRKPAHAHEQPEGVFSRLIRKIFKK